MSNKCHLDVFFDNVQVTDTRGPLIQDESFYPFGLSMAGITSKAAGTLENKKQKFQGQELDDDLGINWYGFKWRNHDPQIGRFIEIDPLSEDYRYNSTYAFSENKVVAHIELEGLEAVFIHGTWSNKSTWSSDFTSSMLKATNWNKIQKEPFFGNWTGANSSKARVDAANKFYNWLTSDDNPLRDQKHATLIGHSHGGNVNKLLKNKLEKDGWKVDIINIETPQRKDFQSNETGEGVYLNFYSNSDIVQKLGSLGKTGDSGSRIDGKAAKNIELIESIPLIIPGSNMAWNSIFQWLKDSGGHSLHNNSLSKSQIENHTKKEFNDKPIFK